MLELTQISGLNKSDIETINAATEILCGELNPDAKNRNALESAIQDRVIFKYLSGISIQELVNMCR